MKKLVPIVLAGCASPLPDELSLYGFRHWSDGDIVTRSFPNADPRSYAATSNDGWSAGVGLTWALSQQETPQSRPPYDPIVIDLPVELQARPVRAEPEPEPEPAPPLEEDDLTEALQDVVENSESHIQGLLIALSTLALAIAGWFKRAEIKGAVEKWRTKEESDD